jgi:hypothetical protein
LEKAGVVDGHRISRFRAARKGAHPSLREERVSDLNHSKADSELRRQTHSFLREILSGGIRTFTLGPMKGRKIQKVDMTNPREGGRRYLWAFLRGP